MPVGGEAESSTRVIVQAPEGTDGDGSHSRMIFVSCTGCREPMLARDRICPRSDDTSSETAGDTDTSSGSSDGGSSSTT